MSDEFEKYKSAVGVKSVDGRKYADAAYADFLAILDQVRSKLEEIDVTYQISPKNSGFSLSTPFGAISAEKEYFLDGDYVAAALLFTDVPRGSAESPARDLGAVYLNWNRPWSMSTGETFSPDFATDKYSVWVASKVIVTVMAVKLMSTTEHCASLTISSTTQA